MAKTATPAKATGKVVERLSAKEVAAEWDTTPRTVRKFFREMIDAVGRGNRYALTPGEVKKLAAKFDKWVAAQVPADAE